MRKEVIFKVALKMLRGEMPKTIIGPIGRKKHRALINDISQLISIKEIHKETFGPIKNICQGEKDVVICGAGPSLQNYEPIEGAMHIALNRAFLYEKVHFDYIIAKDFDGIRHCMNELKDYEPEKCTKLLGICALEEKKIPESFILSCGAKKFYTDGVLVNNTGNFKHNLVVDIEYRPISNMDNIGQAVMQIALYMNPKHIYIVGCDSSGVHFSHKGKSSEEFKTEEKIMNRHWKKSLKSNRKAWLKIKHFAEVYYPNTDIISINPVGLKGIFKDLYL